MTFGEFKVLAAAFMQRDPAAFVYGEIDYLARAVNMARKSSERRRDFEMSRTQAQLSVSLTTGAALSGAVLTSNGTTAVSIKTILKGWVPDVNGNLYYPIRVISRTKYVAMVGRALANHDFERAPATDNYLEFVPSSPFLVREAESVFLAPASTTAYGNPTAVVVKMDVIKWLDDYVDDTDTDYFLEHCEEYMLLKTASLLQPFVKEDIRMPLLVAQLNESWKTVVSWDSQLIGAGSDDDAKLD